MTENETRLGFLLRKTAGERLRPALSTQVAAALGLSTEQLKFLSLAKSDEIRQKAGERFRPRDELERTGGHFFARRTIPSEATPLNLFSNTSSDVLVILPESDRVGVLQIAAAILNDRWGELLRSKSDGFVVVDLGLLNQAVVDFESNERPDERTVVVAAWGELWSKVLQAEAFG